MKHTEFPFKAKIIANFSGHDFRMKECVTVTDFYTTFKNVDYYHAENENGCAYVVREEEFEKIDS